MERLVQERTQALQKAAAEMESFAHSASHDLRAPLRTVELSARMIAEDEGSTLSPDSLEMLARQKRAVERMSRLINDLLNYSRLSAQSVSPRELDLSTVARYVWDEITRENPPEGLSLEIEDGLKAWGDPTLIRFVLQNLLQNAIKFSPNGGAVRVGRSEDGAFFVRDEGVGFDTSTPHKLFKPFQRLVREARVPRHRHRPRQRQAHRRAPRRPGLGRSEPGQGATFHSHPPPFRTDRPSRLGLPRCTALKALNDSLRILPPRS